MMLICFHKLTMQLEYFETILNPYLTVDATESLKSLQGAVLEKATESISETVENNPGGHQRKPTRGSEDAISDDKQSSVSPDDLLVRPFLLNHHLIFTIFNTAYRFS